MGKSNGALTQYSFLNVVCMVNGRQVTGYWEGDDAVMVEAGSAIATKTVGADGAMIVSISADRSADITLKLQPNSPMHSYLNQIMLSMQDGNFDPFPVSIRDTRNGEGGSSALCTLSANSNKSLGMKAVVREWKIIAQAWEWNEQAYA